MFSKRSLCLALALVFCCAFAGLAHADSYNYMSPETVKQKIEAGEPMHLVDIQVQEEFAAHHLPGALKTCAYPVKSDADKGKLETFVADLAADTSPVVVVCPRGKGGAKRAIDYLQARSIDPSRLFILEHGQGGWPYNEMIETE